MTTNLAKKVDMFVLEVTNIKCDEVEELIYIHPEDFGKIKKQLQEKTFIDLWNRMLPRKRISDLRVEKYNDELISFLNSLSDEIKEKAKNIILERKKKKLVLNGSKHLKQILKDRGFNS